MKIFISWSADSKGVATAISDALPRLFDDAEPWISTETRAGAIWLPELERQLDDTEFGIVCVTQTNMGSRWLHYEAGALSRKVQGRREIMPVMLIDIDRTTDVDGPLAGFQMSLADQNGFFEMMKSLNDTRPQRPVPEQILRDRLAESWPSIQKEVDVVRNGEVMQADGPRDQSAVVGEILEIVRGLAVASDPAAWLSATSSAISDGISNRVLKGLEARTDPGEMSWTRLDETINSLVKRLNSDYPPDFMVGVYPEGGFVGYLLWLESGREWPLLIAPDADVVPLPEELAALGARIVHLCDGKLKPNALIVDASMKTGKTMRRTAQMVEEACQSYTIDAEIRTLCLADRSGFGTLNAPPDFVGFPDFPQFPFESST